MDNKNVVMVNCTVFASVIGVVALGGMIAASYSPNGWVAWLFVLIAGWTWAFMAHFASRANSEVEAAVCDSGDSCLRIKEWSDCDV